jgi:hypothetical protein
MSVNEVMPNIFGESLVKSNQNVLAKSDQAKAVAEVQAMMIISKTNPRDQRLAFERIINACTRKSLAEQAVYQYARGGTDISGASIRLAEAIAQNWGNIQFGIRELEQADGVSTVQAYAWDIETNTRREMTFQVSHIRHTKKGQTKLTDPRDIYEIVANNGARRLRACLLSIIPTDVTEAAVRQCEITLKATADTSVEAVHRLLEAFKDLGVTQKQIEIRIQRNIDVIQPAQILQLRKIYVSLRDGMSNVSDWFEVVTPIPSLNTPAEKPKAPPAEFIKFDKATVTVPERDTSTADLFPEGQTSEEQKPQPVLFTEERYIAVAIKTATSSEDLLTFWESVPENLKPKYEESVLLKLDSFR